MTVYPQMAHGPRVTGIAAFLLLPRLRDTARYARRRTTTRLDSAIF